MAESKLDKSAEPSPLTPAVSPDTLEDVSISERDSRGVVGGGTTGLRVDNQSTSAGMSETLGKSAN
jgi:hypothetical protein